MRILIVEDDEDSRVLLQNVLTSNGYDVNSAENGKKALTEIKGGFLPDLIISDILMPEMDGYALRLALKDDERFSSIPFVFYTSTYVEAKDEQFAMSLGVSRFFIKPMDFPKLLNEIKIVLEEHKKSLIPKSCEKNNVEVEKKYSEVLLRKLNEKVRDLEAEQDKLKKSKQKYKRVVEALRDNYFFYTHDTKGVFTYLSPSITTVLGYSQENFLTHYSKYITDNHINEAVECNTLLGLQGIRQPSYELEIFHKDGSTRLLDITEEPIFDKKGKVVALEGLAHDITEKRRIENQLRQAQKMETIGLMAGGVAHDLNNILAGIIGYPELILNMLQEDSELIKPIEAIKESGERAASVVDDLLAIARSPRRNKKPCNINDLAKKCVKSPEYEKLKSLHQGISYQCDFSATQANIFCSSVHVEKCLMNLVINATEAIVDDGVVVVSTHNQYIDEDTSIEYDIKVGEYVVLCIHDTGSGISDSDLDHIFEPFYTKKSMGRSGTGLGLAVVWNTIEDHNGKIFVKSSNDGTYFKLYFPISKDEFIYQAENTKIEDITGNGESILIVDDEPYLQQLACQMLQSLGYKAASVSSGELAVKYMKQNPVDLIVIDMIMGSGMNGHQTYKEITKLYPNQKAIIISGFSKNEDVNIALEIGVSEFVKKPYSMNQFGKAVKKALYE